MLLKELLDALRFGELSQISLGGEAQGTINKVNFQRVASTINLGLTNLYTRFNLKEAETTVVLESGKYSYVLANQDLLKVSRAINDQGLELSLNNISDPLSVVTTNMRTIKVPQLIVDMDKTIPKGYLSNTLQIIYRANHVPIDTDPDTVSDEEDLEIELPYQFLEPLTYFIASRAYTPLDTTGQFHSGNNYATKFEQACQRLEMNNSSIDRGGQSDTKFVSNGWV